MEKEILIKELEYVERELTNVINEGASHMKACFSAPSVSWWPWSKKNKEQQRQEQKTMDEIWLRRKKLQERKWQLIEKLEWE